MGFSPHNGEIVIKVEKMSKVIDLVMFPSPQWGSNSKVVAHWYENRDVSVPAMGSNSKECYCGSVSYQYLVFQSPRWGDNSKVSVFITKDELFKFPSPQWGVILKNIKQKVLQDLHAFPSPQWGVILKKVKYMCSMRCTSFRPRNGGR